MRALITAALIAGCGGPAPYLCAEDADCGANGHCEADLHCSIDDGTCTSGRRYVAEAGERSELCTDDPTLPPPPPPGDDYALCGVTAAKPATDSTCAPLVCADDPACCSVGWDEQCARAALARCSLGCDMVVAAGGYRTGAVFRTSAVTSSLLTIPHDNWNYGLAWGDIEGDGRSDLAVARDVGAGTDGVVIFRSDGLASGKLVMTPATITGAVGTVETLEWRDFDADGDLDLLASGSGGVYLVVTDGSTFTAHRLTPSAAFAAWVDHDGQAPWRIATFSHALDVSEVVLREVTLSGGTYTMSAGTSLGTQEGARMTWCNVAGSAERDLITGDRLRIGNGTSFATAMPLGALGYFPECADLDGDGDNDIVLGTYDRASIIMNDGALTNVPLVVPSISVAGIAIGDLDGNGRIDVVLSNGTNDRAEIPLILLDNTATGLASKNLPDWNTADWDSYGLAAGPLPAM